MRRLSSLQHRIYNLLVSYRLRIPSYAGDSDVILFHVYARMDGYKEICQRLTEMEKARRPMFQQELEELKSKVRSMPAVFRRHLVGKR